METSDRKASTAQSVSDWRTIRPDFDPVSFSIMMHISRLGFFVGQISSRAAKRHGINRADARLLMTIRGNLRGEPLRPSMLGERLDLTRATITYRMDRLLAKGLAERTSDANDGRALNVRLTETGRTVVDAIMTEINTITHARIAAVQSLREGRQQLHDSLAALVAHWEDFEESAGAGPEPSRSVPAPLVCDCAEAEAGEIGTR